MADDAPQRGQGRGSTRREVLIGGGGLAIGAAAGAAVGAALAGGDDEPAERATERPARQDREQIFAKDEQPTLKVFGTELGTKWYEATTFVTPHDYFFVRNRYASPRVNPDNWQLKVSGDGIERPMQFSYEDLLSLPSRHAPRVLECFGNGRTVNREQLGYEVEGGNWGFSAYSQGEWDYVPIGEILDRVRPNGKAREVLFWSGVDGKDTGRPIDIDELRDRPEVIGLAYGLNGLPLPADHGGPVRALVPGWGGAASVKWLTEMRISSHGFWTRMHTREEALIGEGIPVQKPRQGDEFLGASRRDIRGTGATWQNTKSFLALPYVYAKSDPPGRYDLRKGGVPELRPGRHTILGYANSPFGIERVEYRVNKGAWRTARLLPPTDLPYSRVRFEVPFEASRGEHVISTRATDKRGDTQPARVPLNELGILCNAIPEFRVNVA
jgi:DMSO/TMAO reductase YedYZ molybdopterin-dependent catalytic subunit